MTLIPNPVAILLLSIILGAAFCGNVIGAEAYLISVTTPVYALYAGVAAGVGYWAFVRFVSVRRLKFAVFAMLMLGAYALVLAGLGFLSLAPPLRAVTWFFMAMFAHRFFRWVVHQLATRHLDPARAQTHVSSLVATYDFGMACALIPMRELGVLVQPTQLMNLAIGLCILAVLFIGAQFAPAGNYEIRYTHRQTDPVKISETHFAPLVRVFSLLALCMGAFVLSEQLLVRTVLKMNFSSYGEIRNVVMGYKAIGNVGIAGAGLVLALLVARNRLAPTRLLLFDLAALFVMGLVCALTGNVWAFVAFEVCRWVGENCLWFFATSMITGSFVDEYRARLSQNQTMFFYPFAGVPLILMFAAFDWQPATLRTGLLVFDLVLLAAAFALVLRLRALLPAALYEFIATGHKTAAILAVNLLSFLRPRDFEPQLERLLTLTPKKLLRKNIILCLGYSDRFQSTDTIIREFETDQEEIQIAVLDALRISHRYKGLQFLTRVTRAEVKPRTIRVRINAAQALAAMYGKHSIPFLLQGLEDTDPRIVANTLETLSEFRDRDLLPYFERFAESTVPRVKANALMGLAGLRATREKYRATARRMLASGDPKMTASILYTIGKLRDRSLRAEILAVLDNPGAMADASVGRCLAWALIRMRDARGHELFMSLLAGDPAQADGFMHYFAQFSREDRMDLVRHAVMVARANPDSLAHLEHALQQRTFDFHEELDYYFILRESMRA